MTVIKAFGPDGKRRQQKMAGFYLQAVYGLQQDTLLHLFSHTSGIFSGFAAHCGQWTKQYI